MNKLVSKNPILRFKEGKKIGKFLNPAGPVIKFNKSDLKTARSEVNPRFKARGSRTSKILTSSKSPSMWDKISNFAKRKAGNIGSLMSKIGGKSRLIGFGKNFLKSSPYMIIGSLMGDLLGEGIWNYLYQNAKDEALRKYKKQREQNRIALGLHLAENSDKMKGPDLNEMDKVLNKITNENSSITRTPYFQSKYADRSKDINVNSIEQMLRMLGVKADGIWGDKTEAAYNSWLSALQDPIIKKDDNVTYTNTNAAVNNANYSKLTSGTLKPNYELNLPAGVSVAYQYLQNNPTLFAKKGGQLSSRNPIQRFKQRNFMKVAQ